MRNYQRRSKYKLPHNVYMQIQYRIRDYDRLRAEKNDILFGSVPPSDRLPHGSGKSNPTEQRAIRLAYIESELAAIDQARNVMIGEYSEKVREGFEPLNAYWDYGYFNYSMIRTGKEDEGPCVRTWHNFKDRFCFEIAKRLKIMNEM